MINIAIDGPAGAGKSTIAKAVAKDLKYIYVDTGALYRTVGLYCLQNKIDSKNSDSVKNILEKISVEMHYIDDEQQVFLNGHNVSDEIRTGEVSMAASDVSAIKEVRDFLFELQRKIARENNIIMDGRDIGTVVLPDADVKIFLTASPEKRAQRRYKELIEKGQKAEYQDVLNDIIKRDYNDSHRQIAPLKLAEGAVLADTSDMTLEESILNIKCIILGKLGENK